MAMPWGSLVVLFSVLLGLLWLLAVRPTLVAQRRQRAEQQLEADYMECLSLIDWQPRIRTPIDDLQDELEVS